MLFNGNKRMNKILKYRRNQLIVFLISAIILFPVEAVEKPPKAIRIKLATLAPKGSAWESILLEMGQKWAKDTNGLVSLTIYPGGVVGDESHMVRKMRIGQFQAASLTTVVLSTIDSAVTALSHIPLLYTSWEELDYVRNQLNDMLLKRFEDKGFVLLNWGDVGWVHFFTVKPMTRPDDLRSMKLFFWSNETGDPSLWLKLGFQPVPLAATDIMMALNTGMIDAFDTTPLAALSNQWFAAVNYMTSMKWAPLIGATVVTKKTWDKIPQEYQILMLAAAQEAEQKLKYETRALNRRAIEVMQEHGLTLIHLDSADYQLWEDLIQEVYPDIRGKYVPAKFFDETIRLRNEYLARNSNTVVNP